MLPDYVLILLFLRVLHCIHGVSVFYRSFEKDDLTVDAVENGDLLYCSRNAGIG